MFDRNESFDNGIENIRTLLNNLKDFKNNNYISDYSKASNNKIQQIDSKEASNKKSLKKVDILIDEESKKSFEI